MTSELFVSRFGGATWAAIQEDGRTVELRVERDDSRASAVGRIVTGRVTRVLPGMQVAFLDAGLDDDAFLHVDDLLLPGEEPVASGEPPDLDPGEGGDHEDDAGGDADVDDAERVRRAGVRRRAPIQDRLREGRELLVQVTRDPIRSKGARVSCYITLPGRSLVFLPQVFVRGVSRRIRDPEERARLRGILQAIPHSGGFIARTAGAGVSESVVRADADLLVRIWGRIEAALAEAGAPAVLHDNSDLMVRMLRDAPGEGYRRVVVETAEARDRAVEYLGELDSELASRVEIHTADEPMFQAHGLDQDIDKALRPAVWLKSGGSLVIEQTEALVSIDVNTGKYVGRRHPEETVLKTNLEAAEEIARQLRLRDLGGIIVIDFIDMERADSRRQVTERLENALRHDRSRTKIVGLSDLGLMQLTRKRTRPGLGSLLTRPCPVCTGHGRVKSVETVAWEALSEVRRLIPELEPTEITVRAHPDVIRAFVRHWHVDASRDEATEAVLTTQDDASMNPETFEVVVL